MPTIIHIMHLFNPLLRKKNAEKSPFVAGQDITLLNAAIVYTP